MGGSGGGGGGTEGIACFAELASTNGIFLEHKIESVADDVIVFDIDLAQLRTALAATLQSAGSDSGNGGGYGAGDNGNGGYAAAARSDPLYNSNNAGNGVGGDDNADNGGEEGRSSKRKRSRFSTGSSAGGGTPFMVVMKLAKRGGLPCLCIDASCAGGALDVHHAVPVRILRAQEWQ